MNRPGHGCLTCKRSKCTGCASIQCTAEESAMTRCAQLANQARKKEPVTAANRYGRQERLTFSV